MTVDEAWQRASKDPSWVPAWKTWSQQRATGNDGPRHRIELQPPQGVIEAEADEHEEAWGEEELEDFLQRCELEAGLREHVEAGEGQRLAEEWRNWEAEMTMAGIQCPRTEEDAAGVLRAAAEEAEVFEAPPAALRPRAVREAHGGTTKKKNRRRWRPVNVDQGNDEPQLDLGSEGLQACSAGGEAEAEVERMEPPAPRGPRRTAEARPRGKRQRGGPPESFDIELLSFNGSGSPQALEAMRVLASRRAALGALMIQEHHARKGAVADLQAGTRARGFKLAASEATEGSGGGTSAGVGVAVPSHRGWGGILGPCWDFSPVESPGRIAGVWLEAGPRGGMVTLSVWLWPTEGMTTRNVRLIEKALEVVVTSGCPWVIAGDFNATPNELVAAAGALLDRAGGVVRAPEQATCYPAVGRARTLDYFIVDSRIAAATSQAAVDEAVAGSPHRAVKIKIRGKEVGGLIRMVKKPRMFPRERPVGCARRPLVPRSRNEGVVGEAGGESLEEEWRKLAYCVEGELCRGCDRVGSDGAPDSRYLGRGEGLRLVLRPMLAPRAMARHGRADAQLHRLAWTLNRVEELIHLTGRSGAGWGDETRRCQWEKLVFSLGKTDGCARRLAELDGEWREFVGLIESLQGRPRQEEVALKRWATRLREAIDHQKGKIAQDRRRAWKDWVGVQIRRGGRRAALLHQESGGKGGIGPDRGGRENGLASGPRRCGSGRMGQSVAKARGRGRGPMEGRGGSGGTRRGAADSHRRRDAQGGEKIQPIYRCGLRHVQAALVLVAVGRAAREAR